MATENFSTEYAETDPNGRITRTASTVTVSDMRRNEDAHVVRDKGVGHFAGDFTHTLKTRLTAWGPVNGIGFLWALANSIDDGNNATDRLGVFWFKPNLGGVARIGIINKAGTQDLGDLTDTPTDFWLEVERDESVGTHGTAYCRIYSDAARTMLVDEISVSLTAKDDLRYVYGCASWNSGSNQSISFTVSDLDLNEAAAAAKSPHYYTKLMAG